MNAATTRHRGYRTSAGTRRAAVALATIPRDHDMPEIGPIRFARNEFEREQCIKSLLLQHNPTPQRSVKL